MWSSSTYSDPHLPAHHSSAPSGSSESSDLWSSPPFFSVETVKKIGLSQLEFSSYTGEILMNCNQLPTGKQTQPCLTLKCWCELKSEDLHYDLSKVHLIVVGKIRCNWCSTRYISYTIVWFFNHDETLPELRCRRCPPQQLRQGKEPLLWQSEWQEVGSRRLFLERAAVIQKISKDEALC